MTTGLIEGWQHFADAVRKDAPLLAAPQWIEVLHRSGFPRASAWPEADSQAGLLGQQVLIAQVAGDVSRDRPSLASSRQDDKGPFVQPAPDSVAREGKWEEWRAGILAALPGERHDLLCDFIRQHVMWVLRRDTDQLPDRHDRLMDLGLDSLMAVQLRDQLGKRLAFTSRLPATLIFDHPTIDALAHFLHDWIWPPAVPDDPILVANSPNTERRHDSTPAGLAAVAKMSDADIEARLLQRFNTRQSVEEKKCPPITGSKT
jgi:aryl carrier-like protein